MTLTTVAAAQWLARNVSAIAADESAGQFLTEIRQAVDAIERVINRPIPPQFCGTCTGVVETTPCGLALYAAREAIEVNCPRCKTTHNIVALFNKTLEGSDDKSFTISELHKTVLPAVREYVAPRTLQHWAARGFIVPTGYGADGEPRFLLADVRKQRDKKPQKNTTGGAAHKRRAG